VISHGKPITLPLTNRTYVEAKVRDSVQRRTSKVAVDSSGTVVDSSALLAAERAAADVERGKLTAELYGLSQSQGGTVPVWIWADVRETPPSKERLLTDKAFKDGYNSARLANVQAQTAKLTSWLDARGYPVYERGLRTPLVLADVPASALTDLGRVDGAAVIGYRRPENLTSAYWTQNIKVPAALAVVSSAAGQSFCNTEPDYPYYGGYLSAPTYYSSVPAHGTHMEWTTELISTASAYAQNDTVAPGATTFVGDWDSSTAPASWIWCFSQNANAINSSSEGDGYTAGGLQWRDMTWDYLAKNDPYPFMTTTSGNCQYSNGNPAACTSSGAEYVVANRGYNYMIVGGAYEDSASTATDTIYSMSAYANWSPHGDYELPHVVAPADSVNSAGQTWSGTSASAPIVLGAALLARQQGSEYLYWWPEAMRSTILASSTHPVDTTGRTTMLGGGADLKHGAGLLNTYALVQLASSANDSYAGNTATANGRYAQTYYFGTDFNAYGVAKVPVNIQASTTGRLRVVLTFDSTSTGCTSGDNYGDCQADTLDADLDLYVYYSNGSSYWGPAGYSATQDGSWELVDIPVTAGSQYMAYIEYVGTPAQAETYASVSWYNYTTDSE
jgi:hypothetical protein